MTTGIATSETVDAPESRDRPAVRVSGGRRAFGDQIVLDDVDLSIAPGEFIALLGASGSGKTTLLRALAGLDRLDAGTVTVPRERSVVFQEPRLIPSRRVWRNVVLGLRGTGRERALEALTEVGLADHAQAWPRTLSGGEAQRVALARALVREPGLLLLDEPFAALDALTRLRMQELVAALCRRHNPAVLLVTHDVDEAIRLADRVLVLRSKRLDSGVVIDKERRAQTGDSYATDLRYHFLNLLGVRGPQPTDRSAHPSDPVQEAHT
ncbi:alkanesulfonate transporter subunit; ATP-binding component of ABC superfamily [Frankia canadensis]|uniref:Alkanesulfonate transporter subunit ATP-binding component of ABC superfamily n=1 Tax=Frankia canadensis TaxID=1836972 RepID=A0A2I2L1G7_9ACTN|nr:ABC transporter ATP-binding protein [Frankia canadensis]SNQ51749.1 alkanesulfonate transporter subunit; ATP-binding component of ABC superfamily [Frankia canadensis]SOU59039.1 alkanesulfonate transporter subunit; ATP-binding component of ABC superfamily [Frankia canadensis]